MKGTVLWNIQNQVYVNKWMQPFMYVFYLNIFFKQTIFIPAKMKITVFFIQSHLAWRVD